MFSEENIEGLPEGQQVEETVVETTEPTEPVEATEAKPEERDREPKQRREKQPRNKERNKDRNKERRPHKGPAPLIFKRFVVVRWSGRREPVDDMFWAEAKVEGDWIVISEFEQVRSRKEILTRLQELPNGLVAFDFPFSYPSDFIEGLRSQGITDWRSLVKTVREDLKKNTDDGTRIWIERMGNYRESKLDDAPPFRDFRGRDDCSRNDRGRGALQRPLPPPYERQSIAERYRRTDHTVRRAANRHLISPVQIGYNKLTSRYEFTDPQGQGRAALLGMSMFEQLLETREDVAIWPMMSPKPLTIVEVLPWIFTQGERVKPEVIRQQLSLLEDRGWEIPSEAVDLAARNTDAQNALRTLIGMIKTESREDRQRRPIRDYLPQFYEDQQVKLEGWFYSVGYRLKEDLKEEKKDEPTNSKQESAKASDVKTETPADASSEAAAEVTSEAPTQVEAESL